ncbi:MAG: FHA domain-containing protein, partial [Verrucomicrobiota bacterium]
MADDDRDRSSVREIRCRDRLWQTFEQMSEEQEKSIEDLINDAMTGYAQIAGYETAVHAETPPPTPVPIRGARPQPFIPPAPARFGRPTSTAPRNAAGALGAPPPPPDAASGAMVYLMFDSQKYRIDKDQFIIGRGTKSSDLPIKDGNISRKHAAVIRRNGTFFIKDLGSTNGIDFNGMRIDNKRIDEGDVFHICE